MDTGLFNEKIFIQVKIDKLINEIYSQIDFDSDSLNPGLYDQDEADSQIFNFLKIFASTNAKEKIDLILSNEKIHPEIRKSGDHMLK